MAHSTVRSVRCGVVLAGCVVWATLSAVWPHASSPPERIISIVPAVTEMLFAIGAGPRIVAVSSFDHFPPDVERLPRVGALLDPNLERILALKADLVVVYGSQVDLQAQLARAGIATYSYAHGGLADVTRTIRELGERTGLTGVSQQLATTIERGLEGIRSRVGSRPRRRALMVFGRDSGSLRNVYASGGVGFLHDMLELAGGQNVFGDVKRESVQATTEAMLVRAPDVIVELRYTGDLGPDAIEREREAWNTLSAVPAVRSKQVFLFVGDEFVVPGPRIVEAAERLARTLHPGAFP